MIAKVGDKNSINIQSVFIISSMLVTLSITVLSAYYKWGYQSAFVLAIGMYFITAIFAFMYADDFLKKLLFFGLVAGVVELMADKWMVENIHSLVYPQEESKIWHSPNYMPFAWAVVLVQAGYLGWLISKTQKMLVSMIICAIVGMSFIPVFEECAYYAGWWYYNSCNKLFNTPFYTIVSEGLICFLLPFIYVHISKHRWIASLTFGIVEGIWIFISYFSMYHLLK